MYTEYSTGCGYVRDCMVRSYDHYLACMNVFYIPYLKRIYNRYFIRLQRSSIHEHIAWYQLILRTRHYTGGQVAEAVILARGVIGGTLLYHWEEGRNFRTYCT